MARRLCHSSNSCTPMNLYAIVTGANTGIGKETVAGLLQEGYHVMLACRSQERASQAITELAERRDQSLDVNKMRSMKLDLANLDSVVKFVKDYQKLGIPLHALINNAGINTAIANTYDEHTEDGFERIFQVNYLGHYLLTRLLMPLLRDSTPAIVVNVSSVMHRWGQCNFETLAYTRVIRSYSASKLANVLFSYELQRRIDAQIAFVAVNPGVVNSDIWRSTPRCLKILIAPIKYLFSLSTSQGSSTTLAAIRLRDLLFGKNPVYLSPYRKLPGIPISVCDALGYYCQYSKMSSSPASHSAELASELWDFSESLISAKVQEHELDLL